MTDERAALTPTQLRLWVPHRLNVSLTQNYMRLLRGLLTLAEQGGASGLAEMHHQRGYGASTVQVAREMSRGNGRM